MKVTCNRESLLSAFQTTATIAPARSPKPILMNVKMEATPTETILMATDMELGIRMVAYDVEVEQPGSAILPVSRFGSLLRENSDERLTIEANEQGIVVQGDRSKFKLPAHNPDEFPSIDIFDELSYFEMPAALMKELIRRTLFATDAESSRYALGGVLLEFEAERITAVGTDGRRLAKMEGAIRTVGEPRDSDGMCIVPARSLQLIDRALGVDAEQVIHLVPGTNDIRLRTDRAVIYSRLVDGRFPKWRDVIPSRPDGHCIELTVGPVISAVRQAAIVSSDESRGIDFTFADGTLTLSGQTADIGESHVELPIAYDGEKISLSLDHRYVTEFLKVIPMDKQFKLNITSGENAALCETDDGYSYVLMPLARERAAKSA